MNPELNDLETALKAAQSKIDIIKAKNDLAKKIWNTDIPRALELTTDSIKLARLENDQTGLVSGLTTQVQIYRGMGDYANALQIANEALAPAQEINDQKSQSFLLQSLGFMYSDMGNYAKGLEYHLKVFDLHEASDDLMAKARALANIGIAYSTYGDSKQAVDYYHRGIELFTEAKSIVGCARAYNSCCVDYTILGDFERAKMYGEKAVDYFQQSGDLFGAGVAQSSLGEVYIALKDYPQAIAQFEKAFPLFETRQAGLNTPEALETQINLGKAYLATGNTDKAKEAIEHVLKRSIEQHIQHITMHCHQLLSDVYENQGNLAAALSHLKQYNEIHGKLLNESSERNLNNLRIIHETQQIAAESERQKKLREQDRQNFERLTQIKNDFLHSATHDIKNPLSVINMGTYMLTQLVPPDYEKAHDYIKRMNESAQKIRRLVEDILDLARLETLPSIQFDPVTIGPFFETIVASFKTQAEAKAIEIKMDIQPPDLIAKCNKDRLGQALENLVSNAIKYTPDKGVIQIRARIHDSQLQVQVIDNGMGIPKDSLPRVFDRFYRVNKRSDSAEGTGLGLSIVKLCVDQHGGKVDVESKLGKGSTFTILLPQ